MMSVTLLLVNTKEYLIIFSRLPSHRASSFEKLKPRLPQSFVIPFRSEERGVSISSCLSPYPCGLRVYRFSKWSSLVDQTTQVVFQEIRPPHIHLEYERHFAKSRVCLGAFSLSDFFPQALRQDLVGILTSSWNAFEVHSVQSWYRFLL